MRKLLLNLLHPQLASRSHILMHLQGLQHQKTHLYVLNFRSGLASDRPYFLYGLELRGPWKIRRSGTPDGQQPARYAKIPDLTALIRARQQIGGSIAMSGLYPNGVSSHSSIFFG
jgi:hypothetical protein